MQGRVTQLEEDKKRWIITRTIKSSYPIKNWKFSKRKVNKTQLQINVFNATKKCISRRIALREIIRTSQRKKRHVKQVLQMRIMIHLRH